jgi:cytidyltransferase-like protein
MNLGQYLVQQLLEAEDQATIALFPGAFKPPHKGHFAVVKKLLEKADQVVVLISPKTREGVTVDESLAIWELYKTLLDGSGFNGWSQDYKDFYGEMAQEIYDQILEPALNIPPTELSHYIEHGEILKPAKRKRKGGNKRKTKNKRNRKTHKKQRKRRITRRRKY